MALRTDLLPELTPTQTIIVESVVKDPLANPRGAMIRGSGDRTRQPTSAKDIGEFVGIVQKALKDKLEDEGLVIGKDLIFTEEYPPKDIESETITYRLLSRDPASMSGGRHLNQERQEWKPHLREISDDPNHPGYRLTTIGQKFENQIVFTCWAKSNKTANTRAIWLEDTLKAYTWFIKYEGVDEFYFIRREPDFLLDMGQANFLQGRPLVYYVRTERLTHLSEPTVRRIILQYSVGVTDTQGG
jgi:hypothetical protein